MVFQEPISVTEISWLDNSIRESVRYSTFGWVFSGTIDFSTLSTMATKVTCWFFSWATIETFCLPQIYKVHPPIKLTVNSSNSQLTWWYSRGREPYGYWECLENRMHDPLPKTLEKMSTSNFLVLKAKPRPFPTKISRSSFGRKWTAEIWLFDSVVSWLLFNNWLTLVTHVTACLIPRRTRNFALIGYKHASWKLSDNYLTCV